MHIHITEEATNWYEQELGLQAGDAVRFFVRYGGVGGRIPGFSLGINIDTPQVAHTSVSKNGIVFFIEDADAWYFEDSNLTVQMDNELQEPQFIYAS